ncbi:MAG TPA: hypothetical protein VMW18_13035 [Candidatus Binatia bacterium]|nr:hypothetical protein [Candidatus Binatia bacterium]
MDVAAAGQAAAQISAAQRTQQVSIAALRSNQLQAQSLVSVLANSAAPGSAPTNTVQPPAAPAQGGNGGDSGGGAASSSNAGQARGSLLNILV